MIEPAFDAGDLVWIDLEPRVGREQGGRRPALVVSRARFNYETGLLVICPITSRVRPFPTSVVLSSEGPVSGEILVSAVRSIDAYARPVTRTGATVPAEVLREVRRKLAAIIGEA